MKRKKLFIVGILMLILVVLTGCGEQSEDKKKVDSEVPVTEQEASKPENSIVGKFVEYDGNLYFWKLNSDSRESTALFAQYSEKVGSKNDLVRLEPDGNEFTIINETGAGNLYIANDTIFYESRTSNIATICSVDLEGKNQKTYTTGELKYAAGDYVYIQSASDIVSLNVKTGEYETTVKNADLVGMADSNAFYIAGDSLKKITIGYIKDGEDNSDITTFSTSEYKESSKYSTPNISFYGFSFENNKVAIKVGDEQGTGHFIQEGWIIEMDADGQNVSKKIDEDNGDGAETLLSVTDLPVAVDSYKGLVYTDPDTGSKKTIVDNETLKSEFGFKTYQDDSEAYVEVYSADKEGDDLYIIVDNGTHYPAEDIGWRYSYKRTKTVAFKYNIGSGEIEKMYEF